MIRRRRMLGHDHPDTLDSAINLAIDLRKLGEYERARDLAEDTLARSRRCWATTTSTVCSRPATLLSR